MLWSKRLSNVLMATCPYCKGHLTDHHRCPRRPAVVAAEIVVAAFLGGFGGLLLVAMLDPRGQFTQIDTIAIVAGALGAVALARRLRR
jgi:hypothetical protein